MELSVRARGLRHRWWRPSAVASVARSSSAGRHETDRRLEKVARGAGLAAGRDRQSLRARPPWPRPALPTSTSSTASAATWSMADAAPGASGRCGHRLPRRTRLPKLLYVDSLIGPHTVNTMPSHRRRLRRPWSVDRTVDADFDGHAVSSHSSPKSAWTSKTCEDLESEGVIAFENPSTR